uniref:Phosphoribosylformylglycinamidine synthase subunit PurL n=1 Tax=Candidatus Methanomethylicus mesodigestus TaxID=1867258 RepID=A0A7C3ILJ5_9CREN
MAERLLRKTDNSIQVYDFDLAQADDDQLLQISANMGIALNLDEMKALKKHFKRPLTDVEIQTFGQTWSEHCIHKTFKGDILTEKGAVSNIFKSYIAKATKELAKEWCYSVFEDNAGLVDFGDDCLLAAKVETHNHPSAVEPFGGAATGIGGVIRDILGVWGEPIATSDVLCFGPLDIDYKDLMPGIKHPKYIYKGVVAGVGSYGNNMGLPTVNGAIIFDRDYTGNVIVYCGCFGVLPKESYVRDTRAGDYAVLAGGKTGRDGIHGVTFASAALSEDADELRSAVQIPNPLVEERLRRATLRIRDLRLSSGITDLGGGGLSCAAGEMAHRSGLGLTVDLDVVHLKEEGLAPWEIWVSESQERMLYSVREGKLAEVMEIFKEEDVEACVIGRFDTSGKIVVKRKGKTVCDLELEFLYSPPKAKRFARKRDLAFSDWSPNEPKDMVEEILKVLSDINVRSREEVIRTYDHEVRACTAIKPLQGDYGGPNDAAVLKPLKDSWMGAVISSGLKPFNSDPYWMAASSIEEALRNNTAVGGRRVAILDNFVWGNPEREEVMWSLLRAAEACYDFSKKFGAPFISGKDSLYNESPLGGVRPTLLITAIGIIPDVRNAVNIELKKPGDKIFLAGETREEMSGSIYQRVSGGTGGHVPKVDASISSKIMERIVMGIDEGAIRACHDLSDGGLAVTASEMVISSRYGIKARLNSANIHTRRDDYALFSESNGRFLLEVKDGEEARLRRLFEGLPVAEVGEVCRENVLKLTGRSGHEYELGAAELRSAWRGNL